MKTHEIDQWHNNHHILIQTVRGGKQFEKHVRKLSKKDFQVKINKSKKETDK